MSVHYFSFYLSSDMEKKRENNPAAYPKVEYVKSIISKSGFNLNLVSTAIAKSKVGFLSKKVINVSDSESHIYLPTFRYSGKVSTAIALIFMWIQVSHYVLFNVKNNDQVLIYHSLQYLPPFNFLRKFKNFKLILEFNDLYHVVSEKHANKRDKELAFIENADAYLFMNDIAEKKFNKNKPYVISYGNYELPNKHTHKINDGKIHIVYAGIIEGKRKAAELALQSTLYLNENYVLHVLGFGSEGDIQLFQENVIKTNKEKGYEAVIFEGKLRGQEFTNFLHSCHIGISSHAYTKDEMDSANYTFPSKIPTYMSHDLHVVSPDIPCVVESPFAEFTSFYHNHTPQDIAKAIIECTQNFKNTTSRTPSTLISELDMNFKKEIKKVLA